MTERALLHTEKNVIRGIFRYYSFVLPSWIVTFFRSTAFVFSEFLHPGNVEKTKQLLKQRNTILRICGTPY